MFCNKCGAPNPDNSAFCSKCGYAFPKQEEPVQVAVQPEPQPVVQPEPQPIPQPVVQPTVVAPQPVAPQPVPQPMPTPAPKKSKKGLIIGIIAGVLVLAAIITAVVLWIVNNNGGSSSSGKEEEKEETSFNENWLGEWYVTADIYGYGTDNEEYMSYNGYSFEFKDDGTVLVDGEEKEYTFSDNILEIDDYGEYKVEEKGEELYLIEYYDGETGEEAYVLSKTPVEEDDESYDGGYTEYEGSSYEEYSEYADDYDSYSNSSTAYGNGVTDVARAFLDSYYTGDFSTASYYAYGYMADQVDAAMSASQEDVQAFLEYYDGMDYEIGEVTVGGAEAMVGIMVYIDGDSEDWAVELENINGEWKVENVDF